MDNENTTFDLSDLTAKNSDYVHAITKQLMLSGKTDEEVKEILADIVPQILEGQKNGILAKNLLGTPTEFVDKYKGVEKKQRAEKYTNNNPKLMILDSILLIFALLSLLYGIMFIFNMTKVYYGLTTLILSSIMGGLAMYQIHIAQTRMLGKDKGLTKWQRFRPTLLLMLYMMLWMFVTVGSNFLPLSINPHLSGLPLILLAALVFASRYFLKKKFNIKSAIVSASEMDGK
ncbi:MAG: DUF1129 family protein [Lactovum sp.]